MVSDSNSGLGLCEAIYLLQAWEFVYGPGHPRALLFLSGGNAVGMGMGLKLPLSEKKMAKGMGVAWLGTTPILAVWGGHWYALGPNGGWMGEPMASAAA